MKPLTLNLSKMKKISGDEHSSTFLHPSGHHMVIAHAGVSNLQRQQLQKMPVQKFDDGGPVASEEAAFNPDDLTAPNQEQTPQSFASQAGQAVGSSIGDAGKAIGSVLGAPLRAGKEFAKGLVSPAGADQSGELNGEEEPSPPPSPVAAAPEPVKANGSPVNLPPGPASSNFGEGYNEGLKSIQEQKGVDIAKAKADAEIQQKAVLDKQEFNQNLQDATKSFLDHQQAVMKDYMAEHINPRHYQESMSTGEKVATGIGLFLGGFSTPFTGGSNPALDFLNKQIDRDIAAQASRQDQQKTLLGANQAVFHDKLLASNQTRINMNDIYNNQIQLAASKLGTPQAMAAYHAADAHFKMENANLLQQNAMRATTLAHLQSGKGGLNAIDLSNAGMIPQAEAVKEQASIDAQKTALQKTDELFDALDKEQTAGNLLNPQSYKRVAALKSELVNAVMNASASKRLTHESIQAEIDPLLERTLQSGKTSGVQRQGLKNIVQRHADPTPYMSHYSPQSLPKYEQSVNPQEGMTASNPKTGQRMVNRNGQWVPLGR